MIAIQTSGSKIVPSTILTLTCVRTSSTADGCVSGSLTQVCRIINCEIRVSINEQFVLHQYTHRKEYEGLQWRGERGLFPFSTLDQGLLQTTLAIPTTSPLPALEMAMQLTPTIYPMIQQYAPTNFESSSVGRPPQDDPMSTGGCTHSRVNSHRFDCHLGPPPLYPPDDRLTQNPEEKKRAEVSFCYLAPGLSF